MSAVVEKRFDYKGYPCVVLMQSMGFRTAYVGLTKNSKYFNCDYDNIPISCHGGLTYSEDYLWGQSDTDTWWIGFDAGHCFDGYDYDAVKELFKDNINVLKEISTMERIHKKWGLDMNNQKRTLDFMMDECKKIVDQLEGNK